MNKFYILMLFIWLGSCVPVGYVFDRYNDKIPVQAQLTDAYSTFHGCGSKGKYSCEVFKGRYWLPDYKLVIDREIDGFVYKEFKANNDKAAIKEELFYRSTLQGEPSGWWWCLGLVGIVAYSILLSCLLCKTMDI